MRQPHDRLFRQTFGEPRHAAALLRTGLPALAPAFNWSTLRCRTKEFVDEGLHEHRGDEVLSVQDHDRVENFLSLEHKAQSDPEAAAQQLRYQLQIWERCLSRLPAGTPLPPIVPIVVHHGSRPWSAPVSLLQGRGSSLHPWTDIRLLVIDFALADEAAILARGLTDHGTATMLFLRVLRFAAAEECGALLRRWQPLLRPVRHAPGGRRALGGLLTYALEATESTREQLAALAEAVGDRHDKDTIMSTADKLRAEGKAEGKTEVLLRLLARRFGLVPPATVNRVRTASAALLDEWTDRILTAPTLEAVFGDR